jgi:hypothetical protein
MKLHIFRISNGAAAADGKLPARLKILAWGDNPAIHGLNPRLGPNTIASFDANMRKRGLDKVALDFEHNTVPGTPAYEEAPEPRAVAAFGVPRLVPGEGLFLDDLVYTPHGASHALDYIDLSPAVHIDPATGEVDFLHSCALTRAGAVTDLSFYSVDADMSVSKPNSKGAVMDWKMFAAKFAGVAEDMPDDKLQEAFEAKVKELSSAPVEQVKTDVATLSALVQAMKPAKDQESEITALSTTVAALKDELTTVHGTITAVRRQSICEQAAREGKVIPLSAEQVGATDPQLLADMVSKLPVTVPVDRLTPEHIQALGAAAVTSALKRVAQTCGMDPAQVAEVNKPKI